MSVPTTNTLPDRVAELENVVYGGPLIGGSSPNGVVVTSPTGSALQSISGPLQATSLIGNRQASVVQLTGSTDALSFPNTYYVNSSGVDAMTLATPVSGTDDGKTLTVTDQSGHAHTITTAANKIVPSHDTATFSGTAGAFITLEAFGGLWYVKSSSGVTMSEV